MRVLWIVYMRHSSALCAISMDFLHVNSVNCAGNIRIEIRAAGSLSAASIHINIYYIRIYLQLIPIHSHFAQQFARFSKQTVSRSADSMHLFCLPSSSFSSPSSSSSSCASIVELSRLICCAFFFVLDYLLSVAVLYHGPSIYSVYRDSR